jgi:hypothetical protein
MADNNVADAANIEPERAARPDAPTAEEIDYTAPIITSIWQHPFVQNILPFVTSFLFHAGLIVLGILTYKTVETISSVVKEQIIIPDAQLVEGAEVGGSLNPGLGNDPNMASAQELQVQDATPKSETQSLNASMGGGDYSEGLISHGGGGTMALRPGSGSGLGSGDAGGSPFGVVGGGGGSGPRTNFMGSGGNAKRIVFICDASGTMLASFPMLRRELQKTISKLVPAQSFNVIFFKGSQAESVEGFPGALVAATGENKSKAYKWISEYVPEMDTNPFPAIEKAFSMQPELVFVLTDGFDNVASYKQVRDAFDKANASRKAKVMTILLQTTPDAELATLLEQIAADHGGRHSVVRPD